MIQPTHQSLQNKEEEESVHTPPSIPMDSPFNSTNTFSMSDTDTDFSGLLEIYVHHARDIHNICIYANQDVYAKFSLTCTPADTLSTRIIPGGGKNPQFDQKLTIKVPRRDAVLKCEIWMLSRARNFLEDQLLGFALVPLNTVKNKMTQDFTLSSTELFHSPAGTVQLTLYLQGAGNSEPDISNSSSITSEVVILDREDLKNLEFPDVGIANENQQMVSRYIETCSAPMIPYGDDCEMAVIDSPVGSAGNSTMTTENGTKSPETPTSKSEEKKEGEGEEIDVEAEQKAMQKQIVDMYMRSMQQFTESLAKMKLPMEFDAESGGGGGGEGDVIQSKVEEKKKDGSRVFYGSRAFF